VAKVEDKDVGEAEDEKETGKVEEQEKEQTPVLRGTHLN